MTAGSEHGQEILKHAKDFAQETISEGGKKIKEITGDVDKRVHKDPWVYIAGAATVSLLLGYFLGSKRK